MRNFTIASHFCLRDRLSKFRCLLGFIKNYSENQQLSVFYPIKSIDSMYFALKMSANECSNDVR